MGTLIFICVDGMDDVAAMSDGVEIRLRQQCDRACGGNAIAFASRKRDW